jgi:hypothetical protein
LVLLLSALADDGSLLTDSPLKVKAVTKEWGLYIYIIYLPHTEYSAVIEYSLYYLRPYLYNVIGFGFAVIVWRGKDIWMGVHQT